MSEKLTREQIQDQYLESCFNAISFFNRCVERADDRHFENIYRSDQVRRDAIAEARKIRNQHVDQAKKIRKEALAKLREY